LKVVWLWCIHTESRESRTQPSRQLVQAASKLTMPWVSFIGTFPGLIRIVLLYGKIFLTAIVEPSGAGVIADNFWHAACDAGCFPGIPATRQDAFHAPETTSDGSSPVKMGAYSAMLRVRKTNPAMPCCASPGQFRIEIGIGIAFTFRIFVEPAILIDDANIADPFFDTDPVFDSAQYLIG
jgi:hypothetical protein